MDGQRDEVRRGPNKPRTSRSKLFGSNLKNPVIFLYLGFLAFISNSSNNFGAANFLVYYFDLGYPACLPYYGNPDQPVQPLQCSVINYGPWDVYYNGTKLYSQMNAFSLNCINTTLSTLTANKTACDGNNTYTASGSDQNFILKDDAHSDCLLLTCFYYTYEPSISPSRTPSRSPSRIPSRAPSRRPSKSPSRSPSRGPSRSPSRAPNHAPSGSPSRTPSRTPSKAPVITARPTPSSSPTQSSSSSIRVESNWIAVFLCMALYYRVH